MKETISMGQVWLLPAFACSTLSFLKLAGHCDIHAIACNLKRFSSRIRKELQIIVFLDGMVKV